MINRIAPNTGTHIAAMVNSALAREESMRYCDDRTEWLEEGGDDEIGVPAPLLMKA